MLRVRRLQRAGDALGCARELMRVGALTERIAKERRMPVYRIGTATIHHGDGQTRTLFAGGGEVIANWMVQDCQQSTAAEYGIPAAAMNRQHDLAHSVLAALLGLPASPTLAALSEGRRWPLWHVEERAALALQGFAHAAGVDLEKVAERLSNEQSASQRA